MSHIFWNKKEIPRPENSYVNRNDGRVFILIKNGKTTKGSKRIVIGHATSMTHMHPNESFKYYFPALWKKHYGEEESLPEHQLNVGMYATCLGIGIKPGLYQLLIDCLILGS